MSANGRTPAARVFARAMDLAVPVGLEAVARVFRLPVFPGFALLVRDGGRAERALGAVLVAVVDLMWLGSAGLEFFAAAIVGATAARGIERRAASAAAFVAVTAVAWSILSVATGRFPYGALGLDSILTAAMVRLTGGTLTAALLARVVFVSVASLGIPLCSALRRARVLLLPAVAALALVSCGVPESGHGFDPDRFADVGPEEPPLFAEPPKAAAPHPPLPPEARANAVCIGCHTAKVGKTDLPPAQKGVHEIHFQLTSFDRPCVHCHDAVGYSEIPTSGPRRRYNQRCAECHSGAGGPAWKGAFR